MNPRVLIQRIRSRLEPVYGDRLKEVVLYGSVARGDADAESDVDVLVVLDEVKHYGECLRRNIEALYPLSEKMGRRISAKPVAERQYREAECPLYRNARREGIAA